VVAVKLGVIASVEMRYGLYAFAAAVILTMYVTARVVILTSDPDCTQQQSRTLAEPAGKSHERK
jgi:paraquat-inducible protein A